MIAQASALTLNDKLTITIAGLAVVVALGALLQGLREYRRQGRQKRAEQFFELRRRLKDPKEFGRIAELIDLSIGDGHEADAATRRLQKVSFREKRDYVGLFEEVALAMNSKLLRRSVANYMFGYYAVLCANSTAFWETLGPLNDYWALFYDFVAEMRKEQADFEFRRRDYRF